MNVVVLFNPIAGSGRARTGAEGAQRELARAGHAVRLVATKTEPPRRWLDAELATADVLVAAGGDGAVRLAADAAQRAQTPLYHLPLGTENLFAREFGMTRDVDQLRRAIDCYQLRHIDVGFANGHLFLLMASIGYDAHVIAELTRLRRGSISHLNYVRPILTQLIRWVPAPIELIVDGEVLTRDVPGWVIIANCRQYGMRLDFARRACLDDGLFDIIFMPVRSRLGVARWLLAARAGLHVRISKLLYRTGRVVEARTHTPQLVQLDGDLVGSGGDQAGETGGPNWSHAHPSCVLRATLAPRALCVLLPPSDK